MFKESHITSKKIADYRITASQLNAFDWFLHNEKDNAEQELISTINRDSVGHTEPQDKGKSFEFVINLCLKDDNIITQIIEHSVESVIVDFSSKEHTFRFKFDAEIIVKMYDLLKHQRVHSQQVFINKYITLQSEKRVELYGYVDYLTPLTVIDLKTTGNYNFPKYITNWQTYVYGYILADRISSVDFIATDFKNVFHEIYNIEHVNYIISFKDLQ
ncbi:MAG: hypothetical protein FWG85_05020 [Bacteroidetes bacterium]|nr:hypothetical protein [Bacteroidota bacterium]